MSALASLAEKWSRSRFGDWVRLQWRLSFERRFTRPGTVLLVLAGLTGGVACLLPLESPLYILAVFLFCFLAVTRPVGLLFRPKVRVTRKLPERCAAGATVRIVAEVENIGRLPAFDLAVKEFGNGKGFRSEDKPAYIDRIPAGGSAQVEYSVEFVKRGVHDFYGPLVMSAFPFAVYNTLGLTPAPARVVAYPRFARLSGIDLPVGTRHQPGGLQLVSRTGESEEFIGSREYRPGDRLRDLDHRAWARTGFPVVREYQQEYLCRVALVLDTYLPKGASADRLVTFFRKFGMRNFAAVAEKTMLDRKGDVAFEAAVSFGAAVAEALNRREYVIDIFAAGPELYHFQAGRSLAYLDNILDVLACIEPCRTNPFEKLTPAILEEISGISTAVVVLLDWDEARERFVKTLRDCGAAVKVLLVREGEPTHSPAAFRSEAGPVQVFTPEEVMRGVDRV